MIMHAFTDGASRGNPGEAGIGILVTDDRAEPVFSLHGYIGVCTNNVAEYTALIRGLAAAKIMGAKRILVRSDSELLVRQINGVYKVKSADLKPLFQRAVALIKEIGEVTVSHVYREGNTRADELANQAMNMGRRIEPYGPAVKIFN